jgi:hypothetical protein
VPQARQLADRLGLSFSDYTLLEQALVHSSYVHEQPSVGASNERLEFLGDSVISLVVSEALWERYPDDDEGSLTTRRAAIVSARGLSFGIAPAAPFAAAQWTPADANLDHIMASVRRAVVAQQLVVRGTTCYLVRALLQDTL